MLHPPPGTLDRKRGGGGHIQEHALSCWQVHYNAESPKQGSKRFNHITKTIHFAHLVILFIYATK